ncbi:MAG: hypothetical protein HOP29_08510 [Phycisphaerales bacterium]|nr:hypothetical protein [Phycisphaerales bacterium]
MAPPFSGIETPFLVRANGKGYYANCVWDALGVAATLHADAVVEAFDGHTGEPMRIEVRNGALVRSEVRDGTSVPADVRDGGPVPVQIRDGAPVPMKVRDGTVVPVAMRDATPVPTEAVAHFAVPAARWWTDIVFT